MSLRFGQLCLFYRADHADNGEELCVICFIAKSDALTDRATIRRIPLREIFVHHADAFRAMRIFRGEIASFAERNAEDREVIAVDAIGIMTVLRLTRRRHIALRRDRGFTAVAAQRNVRDRAGGDDAGLLPDGFQQAIDDADAVFGITLP